MRVLYFLVVNLSKHFCRFFKIFPLCKCVWHQQPLYLIIKHMRKRGKIWHGWNILYISASVLGFKVMSNTCFTIPNIYAFHLQIWATYCKSYFSKKKKSKRVKECWRDWSKFYFVIKMIVFVLFDPKFSLLEHHFHETFQFPNERLPVWLSFHPPLKFIIWLKKLKN